MNRYWRVQGGSEISADLDRLHLCQRPDQIIERTAHRTGLTFRKGLRSEEQELDIVLRTEIAPSDAIPATPLFSPGFTSNPASFVPAPNCP